MPFALDPLGNPIGFITFYFLFYVLNESWILVALKLALYSSVWVFPFAVLGRKLFNMVQSRWKHHRLLHMLLISFIVTLVFFIFVNLWTLGFYPDTQLPDAGGFLRGWIIASFIVFPFTILGFHLIRIIKQKWKMPPAISLYLVGLVMCIIFWLIVTAYFVSIIGI